MIEKPEELFVGFVAQKAIIEREGAFLFVKGKSTSAKWDLPGGRLHLNEEPEEGLVRELKEELNVTCKVGRVVSLKRFIHDALPTPFYFVGFETQLLEEVNNIKIPDDELSAMTWLKRKEMSPEDVYSNCIAAIDDYLQFKS